MSFQSPWLLLGLLIVPIAIAAYLGAERRRARAAAAFAAPAVSPSVVPRRPGWRRHAPPAVALVATAALVLALARPQVSVSAPVEQASIVLAMDHSGSMQATDVAPSRLQAALSAGERFLGSVPEDVRVGAVVFDHRAQAVASPTTDRALVRDALRKAMRPSGGTATGDALATSLAMIRKPGAIVLLSDGASTHGRDPLAVAEEARRQGVPIYTVALGTPSGTIQTASGVEPVPPDRATLAQIAERSGGEAFTAEQGDALRAVYERLGSQVATERQEREVTAAFAGGALLLLGAAAGASLRWFRRLV